MNVELGSTFVVGNDPRHASRVRTAFLSWKKRLPPDDARQQWFLTKVNEGLQVIKDENRQQGLRGRPSQFPPTKVIPPEWMKVLSVAVNFDSLFKDHDDPSLDGTDAFDGSAFEVSVQFADKARALLEEGKKRRPHAMFEIREQTISGRVRFALLRID